MHDACSSVSIQFLLIWAIFLNDFIYILHFQKRLSKMQMLQRRMGYSTLKDSTQNHSTKYCSIRHVARLAFGQDFRWLQRASKTYGKYQSTRRNLWKPRWHCWRAVAPWRTAPARSTHQKTRKWCRTSCLSTLQWNWFRLTSTLVSGQPNKGLTEEQCQLVRRFDPSNTSMDTMGFFVAKFVKATT